MRFDVRRSGSVVKPLRPRVSSLLCWWCSFALKRKYLHCEQVVCYSSLLTFVSNYAKLISFRLRVLTKQLKKGMLE